LGRRCLSGNSNTILKVRIGTSGGLTRQFRPKPWAECSVDLFIIIIKAFQKINHFPGMYSLARKNHLGRNLGKMAK
jgi:hypothetical protein